MNVHSGIMDKNGTMHSIWNVDFQIISIHPSRKVYCFSSPLPPWKFRYILSYIASKNLAFNTALPLVVSNDFLLGECEPHDNHIFTVREIKPCQPAIQIPLNFSNFQTVIKTHTLASSVSKSAILLIWSCSFHFWLTWSCDPVMQRAYSPSNNSNFVVCFPRQFNCQDLF